MSSNNEVSRSSDKTHAFRLIHNRSKFYIWRSFTILKGLNQTLKRGRSRTFHRHLPGRMKFFVIDKHEDYAETKWTENRRYRRVVVPRFFSVASVRCVQPPRNKHSYFFKQCNSVEKSVFATRWFRFEVHEAEYVDPAHGCVEQRLLYCVGSCCCAAELRTL